MLVLGIETSCDETAAAVARGPGEHGVELLSSVVASQDELHARFGGIVPEIASRRHIEAIVPVIREAMQRAGVSWEEVGGLAVTNGPGLIGSLVVGVAAAKAIAAARSLPLVGVNHLEGHIYAAAIGEPLPSPLLALIASGGHSHLVLMHDHGRYEVLARTRDDAPGEAFEKGARVLGFPYPGVARLAELADAYQGPLERMPRAHFRDSWDFSFSGIKTELSRRLLREEPDEAARARLAASYQEAIARTLADRVAEAAEEMGGYPIVVVGGVARNRRLRELLAEIARARGLSVRIPEPRLCTDNGAMAAAAGIYKLSRVGDEGAEVDVDDDLPLGNWGAER
jgi:N6-L-threonylcarbamoyladenine synthase